MMVPVAVRRKGKVGGRVMHLPYMHAPLYVPVFPLFNGVKEKRHEVKVTDEKDG